MQLLLVLLSICSLSFDVARLMCVIYSCIPACYPPYPVPVRQCTFILPTHPTLQQLYTHTLPPPWQTTVAHPKNHYGH
jgi:hypothetical protein